MASEKKMKSKEISERIARNKKKVKEFELENQAYKAKRDLLRNPEVDASKFPGFDQANRIRGGLKKGGSAKGCKLAMKGKGKAYGKNS
jgi:hypothetical protein